MVLLPQSEQQAREDQPVQLAQHPRGQPLHQQRIFITQAELSESDWRRLISAIRWM
jgi:hypothetical protein